MATYFQTYDGGIASFKLTEQPMYGSRRLGVRNNNLEMIGATTPETYFNRTLGLKQYKGVNHLGNVLSTFTDRKIPRSTNGSIIDYYMPDIKTATDYYPFGMQMPGRTFAAAFNSTSSYRFGFNGKENDNEVKGSGNSLDFGARLYDSRLGKWLSIDPDYKIYPSLSTYNFVANNPIVNIDADGKRIYFVPGLGYNPALRAPEPYVSGIENAFGAYLPEYNTSFMTIVGSNPSSAKNGLIARIPDMSFVINFGQKPAVNVSSDIRIENTVCSIAQDLLNNPKNPGEQINILGTSQGSVTVAQAAIFLVENPEQYGLDKSFKIDNLILAGTPVDIKSELYAKLESLHLQKKIGRILYDNYQSKDDEGNYNDQVTELAGTSKWQAISRGFGFLLDAMLGRRSNHPHLKAAANKPTQAGYNSFGEQLKENLCEDEVH